MKVSFVFFVNVIRPCRTAKIFIRYIIPSFDVSWYLVWALHTIPDKDIKYLLALFLKEKIRLAVPNISTKQRIELINFIAASIATTKLPRSSVIKRR